MDKIKQSIIYYDFYRDQFDQMFKKITSVKFNDSTTDLDPSIIIINNISFVYNIVGRFDKSTNIWEWGWINNEVKNKTYNMRELFFYGLDNYDENFKIINNMFTNTKIKIENPINIDILLAITLRFLVGRGFKYFYSTKDNANITKYYILKPVE